MRQEALRLANFLGPWAADWKVDWAETGKAALSSGSLAQVQGRSMGDRRGIWPGPSV
jgi:hypothetical protein